ncbi:MAG TPA: DinB family protein [Saprospiraceae bacterium]|nr:DinB family protein [Saprospiraceae bacterium]
MLNKNHIQALPDFFDRYIKIAADLPVVEMMQLSLDELFKTDLQNWDKIGDHVYAPGKWTIKEILQHLIDCERIFAYRALTIARKDPQALLLFEEEEYAKNSNANSRELKELMEEFICLRQSNILLFRSMTNDMLLTPGSAVSGTKYSVLAIAYILHGHQRWHFQIIHDRYLPLIQV